MFWFISHDTLAAFAKKKNQNELPPIFPFRDKFVLEDGTEQNVPFVVRLQHFYIL